MKKVFEVVSWDGYDIVVRVGNLKMKVEDCRVFDKGLLEDDVKEMLMEGRSVEEIEKEMREFLEECGWEVVS